LKELNDCKETIVTYKKYRKLEMVKEKLIEENKMFSNQLQIQNHYHQQQVQAELKLKNKNMADSSKGSKQTKKRKIKSIEERNKTEM